MINKINFLSKIFFDSMMLFPLWRGLGGGKNNQFKKSSPPPEGRAVKFCFTRGKMLKFFHEDFDLQEVFPPLAGVRGWILGNFVLIHPPTPASGGENPCKPPNFVQKINALKFAKKNLTALPPEGEIRCAKQNIRKN